MTDLTAPARKPARPFFSSGPCAKPPGYSPANLATELSRTGGRVGAFVGSAQDAASIGLADEAEGAQSMIGAALRERR